MDDKTFTYIQDNAGDLPRAEIERIYAKHGGDLLETLSELMNIPKKIELPKTDWEKRREICDAFDTEMHKKIT